MKKVCPTELETAKLTQRELSPLFLVPVETLQGVMGWEGSLTFRPQMDPPLPCQDVSATELEQ